MLASRNGLLTLSDDHRMPAPDGPDLPVANCVLCGWPMDGSVNILEVHVGAIAVYRACADECAPAGVDRRRYLSERHAEGRRVEREIGKVWFAIEMSGRFPLADSHRLNDLECRLSRLFGLCAPRQVRVNPSSAEGLPAAEIVRRVRELLRQEGEQASDR